MYMRQNKKTTKDAERTDSKLKKVTSLGYVHIHLEC